MGTSLGMRTLGDIFEEAKQEQKAARARGMPEGKRRLADVFDEAKRENEEARAGGIGKRKQTHGQRDTEARKGGGKATENAVEVLGGTDERNRQNMIVASLGIRTSADIFEESQREYEERRERGTDKGRRNRWQYQMPRHAQSRIIRANDQPWRRDAEGIEAGVHDDQP
jgi:hypothetical protein